MENIDIELPKPCPVKYVSKKLPDVLYEHITKKINRINEILSDPAKYKKEYDEKKLKIPQIGFLAFSEAEELNKFSDIIENLVAPEMIDIWNKFYKLKNSSLPMLFEFIKNSYYNALGETKRKIKTEEDRAFDKHCRRFSELSNDPTELILASVNLISLLEQFNLLIRPDGADCFEYMDITDPENEIFLKDGKIPYHIDWDLYITDEEYETFMDILYKIVEKLTNRKNKNQTEYKKSVSFLERPETRKNKIINAPQILMIRTLYIRFIELFKKPLYTEISTIISKLFQSEYTENDIIKLTNPVRNKIKCIKEDLRKNGFIKYYGSSSIEEFIYKQL